MQVDSVWPTPHLLTRQMSALVKESRLGLARWDRREKTNLVTDHGRGNVCMGAHSDSYMYTYTHNLPHHCACVLLLLTELYVHESIKKHSSLDCKGPSGLYVKQDMFQPIPDLTSYTATCTYMYVHT